MKSEDAATNNNNNNLASTLKTLGGNNHFRTLTWLSSDVTAHTEEISPDGRGRTYTTRGIITFSETNILLFPVIS